MDLKNRKQLIYLILAGLFVANAILGEILGGKLIEVGGYIMSLGVVPWPVVFISTDLINEYYGKDGVRRLTFITAGLILYAFLVIFVSMEIPASHVSPVTDEAFISVLSQSQWIIAGSLVAFVCSQLLDVFVFWMFHKVTGGKMLWLRATGSTAISQLIDTFIVLGIGFWLPGKIQMKDFLNLAFTNYTYKFVIAVALTPLIYLAHNAIERYLEAEPHPYTPAPNPQIIEG
ncbi:queuosine precursor transporter [Bryobacter aggregatus]|uniref:queuosine precursor transporter n=1 Tax=Bryobacter aggregatus TaxID=360054 RepID=UPI00068D5824|nr:queuosine precursor transporter [Bryobacter aggregatus]